ncbi:hypothetical protein KY289_024497 [Solanum tuberosum]|nr:hypothetical protein KY289_024497 [Solanum tuberosum]
MNGNAFLLNSSCPLLQQEDIKDPNEFDFGIALDALQFQVVEKRKFRTKLLYCFWWGLRNLRFEERKSEQSSFSIDLKSSSNIRPFHVRKPWVASNKKVLDPQDQFLQKWNKVSILVCIFAVSLDPLFFYIPAIDNKNKCLDLDKTLKITACVLRSITDLFYIFHIILKFRTGFIAPSSRVYGRGELIEDSSAIAKRYLLSYFIVDVIAVLPLPQIVIWIIAPNVNGPILWRRKKC